MPFRTTLKNYIQETTGVSPCDDTDLTDSFVFDSMGYILYISFIEQSFHIQIPEEDLESAFFKTLAGGVAYLEDALSMKA